ncbi:MAG TPA: hypothetical protein VK654_10680 [Nitrospirota bacterium]|nr:hypothetical protein [Nitrospirota bacterium]
MKRILESIALFLVLFLVFAAYSFAGEITCASTALARKAPDRNRTTPLFSGSQR